MAPSQETPLKSTTDSLHLELMSHCLQLTFNCIPSPTAFNVGSIVFLPSSSPFFEHLIHHFQAFPNNTISDPTGLILGEGWSRQIPGNTHAEANALANLRTRWEHLLDGHDDAKHHFPALKDVLKDSVCYATMEPCSVRTSGGPSCALELVQSHVQAVFLGVEEPPDYVQCEGVRILQDGGVNVIRVVGLEEQCLEAARRGRGD
ncbi:hypothetical protein I350_05820 [Cryptococcus amylolentus CBS 6273]|uniref:CMP/dCMP-type deaminase domain-containing protein n=1 Tax=Cryptococcus amylolentus CBS 6273 TaxID=1296118 RepID=A0A1E3JS94_9TREE|nr:hypothetical protein I350_05820 [Cryptococcus amylolentus CBS 6273]